MSQSVYNMAYEYIQKGGHFISFTRVNGDSLSEDDVAGLEMKMMESNHIPYLLTVSSEEIDFNLRLQYDITSKRNLRQLLKSDTISTFDFYQLFIKIITVLEQGKLYMLNEDRYVLKQDFIFAGKNVNDLYLTYLPVVHMKKENSTIEELKVLLDQVAGKTQNLQGSELKNIKEYINNPSFSLSGLKELLVDLQNLRQRPEAGYYQGYNDQQEQFSGQNQSAGSSLPAADHAQPDPRQKTGIAPEEKAQKKPAEKNKQKKKKTRKIAKIPPLSQRQKVYTFAGGILAIAGVWKLFEWFPLPAMLITSLLLTGVIGAAMLYFMFFHAKVAATVKEKEEAEAAAAMDSGGPQQRRPGMVPPAGPSAPVQSPSYSMPQVRHEQPIHEPQQPVQPSYQPASPSVSERAEEDTQSVKEQAPAQSSYPEDSGEDTTFLPDHDEDTVFLGDDEEEIYEKNEPKPYFEVEKNGELKQVAIAKSHFTIGRNPSSADYVEEGVGVSRAHLEFIKIDDQYGIKDLGSKNGTKLNDSPLVPYKIYSLDPGDTITLGKVDYQFQWSK